MNKLIILLFLTLSNNLSASNIQSIDAWSNLGFKNVIIQSIDVNDIYSESDYKLKYSSEFVALVVRDDGWKIDEVIDQIRATAKVFTQCNLS